MTETTLTPTEKLEEFERAAIAGDPVTPAELMEARERVTLAELAAKGAAARADAEQQVLAGQVRDAAKAEATNLLAGHDNDALDAYNAAVSALNRLIAVVGSGNARIAQAALILRQGGVAARSWDGSFPDDLDEANHAAMLQGDEVAFVTVDGQAHAPEDAALWVAAAVHSVAREHRGMPFPNGRGNLEERVKFDRPRVIDHR